MFTVTAHYARVQVQVIVFSFHSINSPLFYPELSFLYLSFFCCSSLIRLVYNFHLLSVVLQRLIYYRRMSVNNRNNCSHSLYSSIFEQSNQSEMNRKSFMISSSEDEQQNNCFYESHDQPNEHYDEIGTVSDEDNFRRDNDDSASVDMEHAVESIHSPAGENQLRKQALSVHRSLIKQRKPRTPRKPPKNFSRRKERDIARHKNLSTAERWQRTLEDITRLTPEFFTSDEVRGLDDTPLAPGKQSYKRLQIDHNNNSDLEEMYKARYEAALQIKPDSVMYENLCRVVGQFARMTISLLEEPQKQAVLENLHRQGKLYELAVDTEMIEIYLNYYEARSKSVSTMSNKSQYLLVFARHAMNYFKSRESSAQAYKCEMNVLRLQTMFNASKKETRRVTSYNRHLRNTTNAVMNPAQYRKAKEVASNCLDSIIASLDNSNHRLTSPSRDFMLKNNSSLIDKWCLNFLCLLLVVCGG